LGQQAVNKLKSQNFDVEFINAFELYGVKTHFDINVNGEINITDYKTNKL